MTASTVIVPLDGSQVAERALPIAQWIADTYQTRVLLVSILEAPVEFSSWIGAPAAMASTELNRWQDLRREYLEKIATRFEGHEVSHAVSVGPPARAVVELAETEESPLVVMASHGRAGFRRFVLGSVTARVVRQAPCPVLVVPAHDESDHQDFNLDRVLVPVDGSEHAEIALTALTHLFNLADSRVHLVRVIENPDVTPPDLSAAPHADVDYDILVQYQSHARKEAEAYLRKVASRLQRQGIEPSWEVRDGAVAEEIEAAAAEHNMKMVAMATHGWSGFGRLFIGSVAERLLSEINRPLFLVGPDE